MRAVAVVCKIPRDTILHRDLRTLLCIELQQENFKNTKDVLSSAHNFWQDVCFDGLKTILHMHPEASVALATSRPKKT